MLNKIINIFYLTSFFIFFILTANYYFSEKNVKNTNKSRSLYSVKIDDDTYNLPLLQNDTNDIIEYKNGVEDYKKKKKNYKFWDLIKR